MSTLSQYAMPSVDGQHTLTGIAVIPDAPIACVEFSHGMAEHIERYLPFMEFLAQHRILAFGHNHVGHGGSVSDASELGYLPFRTGEDTLISDILADGVRMKEAYPDLPLFLFGHSMGSFIARLALSRDADGLYAGGMISGTGGSVSGVGAGLLLEKLVSAVRGEHAYSDLIQNIMFGGYNRRCPGRTEFDWLTRDNARVDDYIADPLCGFRFTVSALGVLTCLTRDANRPDAYRNTAKTLPLLLLSGEEDPVGSYTAGVKTVDGAYRAAGIKDLTLTLYPGARHEPLNEENREVVYADILQWLSARIPGAEHSA